MNAFTPQQVSKLPRHIAVIMDGNGRWAQQRHLPRMTGHLEGFKAVRRMIKSCITLGIDVLTLFAFSSENWHRPEEEVAGLMNLFLTALQDEIEQLHKNGVRLRVIGELSKFGKKLNQRIQLTQELTEKNTGLKLVIAANYGGQWDIVQAAQRLAQQVEQGKLTANEVTKNLFSSFLSLSDCPAPDLLIRTSGECRVSNFLLWDLAYTELYFSKILWPDFDEQELEKALVFYRTRERRFGYISEQLSQKK